MSPARVLAVLLALIAPLGSVRADDTTTVTSRSRVALAEPASRGVLQEAARRIRAEIEAAGFDVVRGGAPSVRASGGPFASIALAEDSTGPIADVSLFLHPDGALSAVLRIDARGLERGGAASGLAIRVVERLRASIAEVAVEEEVEGSIAPDVAAWAGVKTPARPASQPAQAFVAPAPASTERPAAPADAPPRDMRTEPRGAVEYLEPPMSTWIGAGVVSLFSIRSLGPSVGPFIHVRRDLPEQFSIGATAAVPLGVTELEAAAGTATVRQGLVLATADRSFGPAGFFLSPRMTVGVGAHVTVADGDSNEDGLQSHTAAGAAFAATLNGGVAVRLAESVRAYADFWTVLVLPEPVVVIDDEAAARGGIPMLGVTAGVEVAP